ncbi:MAG: hypothetical protein M1445_07735 [Bacteroidetes bacterium]|nr:hypothetical protein [Bacteroidota bacterium]MCL6103707.1 hypothetical protein [Bacteroidota bacterium]
MNNPGWSAAEPRVSECRTTTVRANMLLERSGRISVPELAEGRTEGGGTGTTGTMDGANGTDVARNVFPREEAEPFKHFPSASLRDRNIFKHFKQFFHGYSKY